MFKIKFRTLRFFLISYLVVVVQSTLINSVSLGLIKPDIVLLLVVFYGLYNGLRRGLLYGLVMGLCVDALSSGIVGVNVFILASIGAACGFLQERVYTRHFLTKVLVSFFAVIFSMLSYFFIATNFFRLPDFSECLQLIIGTVIYTSLFNIIFAEVLEKIVVLRTTRLI